jgi:decaprenylphospho-beta-D-erythro-pentofuranosid-2-ulose 2-reductase
MPTALILGATSDIGYAIARRFAVEGYSIQLAARSTSVLEASRSDLQVRYGVETTTHAFDAAAIDTHATFLDALPRLPDVTIYVIGYMTDNEKALGQWKETEATIMANYTGAVSVLNLLSARYRQRRSGAIIGISSVAGLRGRQSNFIYGSAKAGFTAYLSGLRNLLYHEGIHVMSVLPGFVNTRMTEHLRLPPLLTAQPAGVAEVVYKAFVAKKDVVYVKWFWRWIMLIICSIPEGMFKKRKL